MQTAFNNMHAFFRVRPSSLSGDMPTTLTDAEKVGQVVTLPFAGNRGTWQWLQPYAVSGQAEPSFVTMEPSGSGEA